MPPGKHEKLSAGERTVLREWVASGAPAYPQRFDDEFAYSAILADVRERGPEAAARFRYLSLHHVAATRAGELSKVRTEFLAAVTSVVRPGSSPDAVDKTGTIFRLDLESAGWHHRPFKKLDEKGNDAGPASGNLFDVVLLEYPLGVIPENSPTFEKLVASYFDIARPVRPFAFVRGDWFAETVTRSPLADDLRDLLKLYEAVPTGLERPKSRAAMAAKVEPSMIPALDAWHGGEPASPSTVKGLTVATIDSDNKPRTRFQSDEKFRLRISALEPMYFQYVWVDSNRQIHKHGEVLSYDPSTGSRDIVLLPEGNSSGETGKARLIVFASPSSFDAAEVWRARHETKVIERFVHPFFPLKRRDERLLRDGSALAITRRTVEIEIAKGK